MCRDSSPTRVRRNRLGLPYYDICFDLELDKWDCIKLSGIPRFKHSMTRFTFSQLHSVLISIIKTNFLFLSICSFALHL
jgi:hypothetical protein